MAFIRFMFLRSRARAVITPFAFFRRLLSARIPSMMHGLGKVIVATFLGFCRKAVIELRNEG